MTDFGPLIAQPSSFLMVLLLSLACTRTDNICCTGIQFKGSGCHRNHRRCRWPTAIYLAVKLAPHLLGPIAVAAYTYMSLVPIIQPPIMRLMVTEKEAKVRMKELRTVSKVERILFPIAITVVTSIFVPASTPLIGAIMFGNLLKEAGETRRLAETAGNELINIVTIFQALAVGASMKADTFLTLQTLEIVVLGVLAFAFATFGGLLLGKLMYYITGGKVNPLIGSAGFQLCPCLLVFSDGGTILRS